MGRCRFRKKSPSTASAPMFGPISLAWWRLSRTRSMERCCKWLDWRLIIDRTEDCRDCIPAYGSTSLVEFQLAIGHANEAPQQVAQGDGVDGAHLAHHLGLDLLACLGDFLRQFMA